MNAQELQSAVDSLPPIEQRPTFMLHRLNAELARVCNPLFRRLGVDLITSRILVILLERQKVCVGDIVELMALPQSTVSHQLKRLEHAGLVARRTDAVDNRSYLVHLTKKGRRVAGECNAISASIYQALFGDALESEMLAFAEQLERMGSRLRALDPGALG